MTSSPFLTFDGGAFAGVQALAFADAEDLAAFGFFLGGVGQDDAALGFGFRLDALDEDFVTERTKLGHERLLNKWLKKT